jgi:hypothetical protein
MALRSQTFWSVRRGNDPAQCEDAFAADDAAGRYALADGASEGCFSRLWAGMLVRHFVGSPAMAPDGWSDSLSVVQSQWDADVSGRPLRASAERGVRQGAFATFLGIVFDDPAEPRRWQATAVGDTCLMHTRGGLLLRAFPLETVARFGNHPDLVGSRMSAEAVRRRQLLWVDGRGEPGDRLWAMTDALAHYCLAEQEDARPCWSELESLLLAPDAAGGFATWIERLRDARRLKNDDVTLLAIEI